MIDRAWKYTRKASYWSHPPVEGTKLRRPKRKTRVSNIYLRVLVENRQFRNLWAAQVVSQCGDWFNSIALYTLVLKLTGRTEALGLLVVAQFLPAAVAGFWVGPLVDRFSRRTLMFGCDLARSLLALCFLIVTSAQHLHLIYFLTVLMVICQALFEPARKAILPDLVAPREMVAANAVAGATWSSMLAFGAALGGLVTGLLGVRWGFCLNSLSFLVSAWFVRRIDVEESTGGDRPLTKAGWGEAIHYLNEHRKTAVLAACKLLWCLSGGLTLVLTLYGNKIFPLGKDGALSIGLFYACRGLGAAIGPFVAHRVGGSSLKQMERALLPSFLVGGLGYFLLARSQTMPEAMVCIVLAHLGGATSWVFSTTILQLALPSQVRGRVFSLEFTGLTLATATSSYLVGLAGDRGWSAPELAQAVAATLLSAGLVLAFSLNSLRKIELSEAQPEDDPKTARFNA